MIVGRHAAPQGSPLVNDASPTFVCEPSEALAYGVLPRSAGFWAVCAYMALYVIRPWEVLFPELSAFAFERFAYVAILAVVAASSGLRLRFDAPTVGVLSFAAALFLTVGSARDPGLAWSAPDGFYVYLTKLFALLIIVSVVRSPYELFFLVAVAVAAISLYAEKSLWEYLVHGAGRNSMGVLRMRGMNDTFGHANSLATLLVSTLPWWLYLARSRQNIELEWPAWWRPYFKLFLIVVPILFVVCVLCSGSRSGAAGLVVFAYLSVASSPLNRIRNLVVLIVAGVVAWSMLGDANKQRIRSIWDNSAAVAGGEESKQGRIEGLRAGLTMLEDYPITGVGMGNFGAYRKANVDGSHLAAHNIPGQLFGETGILGTAAFALMLSTSFMATRSIARVARYSPDPTTDTLSALAVAIRHTMYLMLFLGLAGHLSYHFIWIWLATFSSCMLWLCGKHLSLQEMHHTYERLTDETRAGRPA